MKTLSIIRPLALAGALLGCGLAQANLIQNGSFETGANPGGSFIGPLGVGNTSIDDWAITVGTVDYIGGLWQHADGDRSIDLVGTSLGTINQTFATVLDQIYSVKFAMASNVAGGDNVKRLKAIAGDFNGDFSFDDTGKTNSDMGWTDKTFQFKAQGTQTTLSFAALNGECCFGPALDNVRVELVDNQVPEPVSALLVGLSLASLGWSRRNRQRTAG